MKEATFQAEVSKSFRELIPESHYFKIPDAPIQAPLKLPDHLQASFNGAQKAISGQWLKANSFRRMPMPKPYDCFCVHYGKFYAMELKMLQKAEPFAFNRIRPNQMVGLRDVVAARSCAMVLLNVRIKGLENTVYLIPYMDLLNQQETIGRKSIPFSRLNMFRAIDRVKLPSGQYGWNVKQVIDYYV